jgi:tRNA-specific 2-thiouridylase
LLKKSLVARQINVLSSRLRDAGEKGMWCTAKIRYNHSPQAAVVKVTGVDEMRVEFDEAQSAITPGQAVCVFEGDVVLGGGWIEAAE